MRHLIVVWLALLAAAVPPAAPADGETRAKAEQLDRLRARISALEKSLNETRGERDQARTELRAVERDIGRLLNDQKTLQARIKTEGGKLQALRQRAGQARAELDAHGQSLAGQVRAAYAMGDQEYIKLLLNQHDPASMARVHVYYRYLTQARAERIGEIRASLAHLAELENQIVDRNRQLAAMRAEQEKQQQELQANRGRRTAVLASLNQKLSGQSQSIERLKNDERSLVRLIRELSTVMADTPSLTAAIGAGARFHEYRGKLPLPVKGRILSRYGEPKNIGDIRWKGLFMAADEGRDVKSVFRGRVAYADWLRGFGMLIVLDHGDGYMTLYGHNQSLYKSVGDWVEAGQAIASVGNTGGNPQSGLYFEIRHQGEPRDPLQWCRAS